MYENILIYGISCKTFIGSKPLRISKVDGFIRVYVGSRYFVLFDPEEYDAIYNRTRYLIGLKSGIIYVFIHYYTKIKVDSYDSLPL